MSERVSGLMGLKLLRVSGENQEYTGTLQEDLGKCSQKKKNKSCSRY